jgi:site-specific recombinase XerD
MAIALGTNDLITVRRHLARCERFPKGEKQPLTHRPKTPQERKADSCDCPIWCLGYLAKENEIKNGKLRPKRVFASLGTSKWTAAEKEVANLYKTGSLPALASAARTVNIDKDAVTVVYAGERYLQSRTGASLNPVEKDTYDHYASFIDQRLIPYCVENEIERIRDFENTDVCRRFTESWRQLRRSVGSLLEMTTRKTELARFRTFLKFCVTNGWMARNGALEVKIRKTDSAEESERFGLELSEYQQILNAPDSVDLTEQENRETRAATELMRWAGLRISDAHKFNDSEIVRNESNHGWNAHFIMKKTKKRCTSPMPDHVVEMLKALPGRMEDGKKYFFTCEYSALRERVDTLAVRAQREKPFKHPFSPHCLRHTFAIQHLNQGTDIKLVSKWLGHGSIAVTVAHYSNWIGTTKKLAEDVSREANARMMAQADALPD